MVSSEESHLYAAWMSFQLWIFHFWAVEPNRLADTVPLSSGAMNSTSSSLPANTVLPTPESA